MSQAFNAQHLDLAALAQAGVTLQGQLPLGALARLREEAGPAGLDQPVDWWAQGEQRLDAAGLPQVWLHLTAKVLLPLTCQRCLTPADIAIAVQRSFRFVANETQAEAEDEEAEEDVLVLSRDFDLVALLEDELLMGIPLVPRHDACPGDVRLTAQDPDFEAAQAAKPNPFAALATLRQPPKG